MTTKLDNRISFCPSCGRKLSPHWQTCGSEYGLEVTTYYCPLGQHAFEVIDDEPSGYQRLESPDGAYHRRRLLAAAAAKGMP